MLRKLHQLTGIVPLGAFFAVHMYTNSTAMSGAKVFNDHVQDIHHMPYLIFLEVFGIFIPLLFHSIYGVLISAEAKPNVFTYGYGRNWFYFFQRATGIFLFIFLLFHILNLRFGLIPGLESYGDPVAGNAGSDLGDDAEIYVGNPLAPSVQLRQRARWSRDQDRQRVPRLV